MNPSEPAERAPGSFFAYLQLLQRYALLILLTGLLGVGLAGWLLLNVIQPVYQASTSLLVIEQRGGSLSGLVSQLENELESLGPLRALALQGGSSQSPAEELISILRSRTLAEKVARQLPLKVLTEVQHLLAKAPAGVEQRLLVEYLQKHTKILPPDSQDGTLRIRIRLGQPDLSAQAANLYVRELQTFVGILINREQGKQLSYLEAQLHKLERELAGAETGLLRFQQRHRSIALDEEVKQLIKQLGDLEADELSARAALQDARARTQKLEQSANELSPDSPRTRTDLELNVAGLEQRQQTLARARQRYQQLLTGLPLQALELARLERELNLKSKLYLLLQQQVQATRLDAARSVELFRVLDPALPPLEPVQPVKGLWLAISGIISVGLGIVMASILDYVSGLRLARRRKPVIVPAGTNPETLPAERGPGDEALI
ncbi:MAG: GNVR domain-containing protein [Candidatus Sericytochromatia bacterium]